MLPGRQEYIMYLSQIQDGPHIYYTGPLSQYRTSIRVPSPSSNYNVQTAGVKHGCSNFLPFLYLGKCYLFCALCRVTCFLFTFAYTCFLFFFFVWKFVIILSASVYRCMYWNIHAWVGIWEQHKTMIVVSGTLPRVVGLIPTLSLLLWLWESPHYSSVPSCEMETLLWPEQQKKES